MFPLFRKNSNISKFRMLYSQLSIMWTRFTGGILFTIWRCSLYRETIHMSLHWSISPKCSLYWDVHYIEYSLFLELTVYSNFQNLMLLMIDMTWLFDYNSKKKHNYESIFSKIKMKFLFSESRGRLIIFLYYLGT